MVKKMKRSKQNLLSMNLKKSLTGNMDITKLINILFHALIVVYILGVVPYYSMEVNQLFANPALRLLFVVVVVGVWFYNRSLSVLLFVAFLVSLMTSMYRNTPLGNLVNTAQTSAQQLTHLPAEVANTVMSDASHVLNGQQAQQQNMSQTLTVQQSFEELQRDNGNCADDVSAGPGCQDLGGYNSNYDPNGSGCMYDSVSKWSGEMNAQGFGPVMGYTDDAHTLSSV